MIPFVVEHKVAFLIGSEVIFWVFVSLALILRYWFRLKKASFVAFIILILNEVMVFLIGVFDYLDTGTFSSFQILIVAFILYALIFGKKDFKKLDHWIQKKVARFKGEESIPVFDDDPKQNLYGKEHAKLQRRNFYIHFLIFVAAHIVFALLFGFIPDSILNVPIPEWLANLNIGSTRTNEFNVIAGISSIWTKILLIDFIWSFSYTIWPKKEKPDRSL